MTIRDLSVDILVLTVIINNGGGEMPIRREELDQEEERIKAAEHKIQYDLFKKEKEWMFSIEEIAKKFPRFSQDDIEKVIVQLGRKDLLVCKVKAGKAYYGLKYT